MHRLTSQPPSPLGKVLDTEIKYTFKQFNVFLKKHYELWAVSDCKLIFEEITMQNKKHFTFLPNGKPVSTLKNEARKLHKSGEVKGLTAAQNHISKALFNKSFNKLVPELEERSPVVIGDTLFLPLVIKTDEIDYLEKGNDFCYYVTMNNEAISPAFGFAVPFDHLVQEDFIENLSFHQIEKLNEDNNNGWLVRLTDNHFVTVKTGDEGINVDLWFEDEEQSDVLNGTWLLYNEMVSVSTDYSSIENKEIDDYEAAYLLAHDTIDDHSPLFTIGDIECSLYSTWTIYDQDGQFLNPNEAISESKINGNEKLLWNWLRGKDHPDFEEWSNESSPYFGYCTTDGDPCGEVFGCMPKTLSEKCFEVSKHFFDV